MRHRGFAVAVHGGAGAIDPATLSADRESACRDALREAVGRAAEILDAGGGSLDAVVEAVVVLEDAPVFNAGRGSVLTADETVEMDAAVMDGRDRRAGAVTCVRNLRHPVRAAVAVMEHTPHVLLAGEGAERFALGLGLELADLDWLRTEARRAQLMEARGRAVPRLDHGDSHGTVGAVARDRFGHLASATSTGGLVGKRPGRVGDTPIIGAGTFAWDATCAVSGTGHGEAFVRGGLASRVSAWMEIGGLSLQEAADRVIHQELPAFGAAGGLIAVDARGRLAMPFHARGMFRASIDLQGDLDVAIW